MRRQYFFHLHSAVSIFQANTGSKICHTDHHWISWLDGLRSDRLAFLNYFLLSCSCHEYIGEFLLFLSESVVRVNWMCWKRITCIKRIEVYARHCQFKKICFKIECVRFLNLVQYPCPFFCSPRKFNWGKFIHLAGSGKTAAFLIPILSRIFEDGPPSPPDVCTFYVFFNDKTVRQSSFLLFIVFDQSPLICCLYRLMLR